MFQNAGLGDQAAVPTYRIRCSAYTRLLYRVKSVMEISLVERGRGDMFPGNYAYPRDDITSRNCFAAPSRNLVYG